MITLRPRRSVVWQMGLALATLVIPLLFVVLLAHYRPIAVPITTASTVALVLLCGVAVLLYGRTHVKISRAGIVERGFLGGLRTSAARDIDRVVRLPLYEGSSLETTSQLFVVGRDGRSLFRMRGQWWDDATMDRVAGLLGVDEEIRTVPATLRELRRAEPGLLRWFERGLPRR